MIPEGDTKKKILELLVIKERDWKGLKKELGVSDPVLAKHIRELEEKGLIRTEISRKDRRKKIYKINEEGFKAIRIDLASFLIYVGLMDAIKIKLAELKEKSLKEVKKEYKPAYELVGSLILEKDAEELRKLIINSFGSLCLEAMILGGDYLKLYCKVVDLFAPVLDMIYLLKDGEIIGFRDYVLERDKLFQETVGKLKLKDFEKVVEAIKDILKKDLMFHKALLQDKERIKKLELNPELKRMFLEHIEYMINVSKHYFDRIKKSPFLASLCDSIAKELKLQG